MIHGVFQHDVIDDSQRLVDNAVEQFVLNLNRGCSTTLEYKSDAF